MNPFSLAGLLAAASSIGFGIFVYAHGPHRALYQRWLLFTMSVALWGVGACAIGLAHDPVHSYAAWRLSFALGVIWIAPFFLEFVTAFCELKDRTVLTLSYIFGCVFVVFALVTPYFFAGVRPFGMFYYAIPGGAVFWAFVVWWFAVVTYTHALLVRAYPHAAPPKQRQIRAFFIAIILAFGTGSLAYLPFFHIDLYPYGTFGIALYPIIMSYAIVEFQLMDINLLARKTLLSSIGVALLAFGLLLVGLNADWLSRHLGMPPLAIAGTGSVIAFALGNLFWMRTKRLDKLRYEFVTVAAHKLRTPLTEIRWAAEELRTASTLEDAKYFSSGIFASSTKMLELVKSLLLSIQVDEESYEYKFAPCDLGKIANQAVAEHHEEAARKRITLTCEVQEGVALVRGDAIKLSSVAQIFVENALLYTPEEGTVSVTVAPHNTDYVLYGVRDSGMGIDKASMPHLFSRLYRGRNALLASPDGAGLSLYIAKQIVERHRGTVGADSDGDQKGAFFWFAVPRA